MESFDINHNNEFVEDSEGSIKIDGVLSDPEKRELEEAFKCNCGEIKDTTNHQMADFLHTDIIPNLDSSNLEPDIKQKIKLLSEKYIKNQSILEVKIPESLEETLSKWGLNLSVKKVTWNIESFINTHIKLPEWSKLSQEQYKALIWNIDHLIQSEIWGIKELVEEKIADNSDLSPSEMRWIINWYVSEAFSRIVDDILIPTKLVLDASAKELRREITDTKNPSERRFSLKYLRVLSKNILSWEMQTVQEWKAKSGKPGPLIDDIISTHKKNIASKEDISLLSEADQEIEKKAMLLFMWAIAWHIAIEWWPAALASVVPVVWTAAWAIVWNFLWAWIDLADTFSDKETLLELIKKTGQIPEEFNMEKTYIDNILAGVGLIPGVTLAIKSAKLAALMAKFWISGSDVLGSMKRILPIIKRWNTNPTEVIHGKKISKKKTPEEISKTNWTSIINKGDEVLGQSNKYTLSKKDFNEFFSLKEPLRQQTSNCYLISVIETMRWCSDFEDMIRSSVKKLKNGSWEVSTPFMSKESEVITITPDELKWKINRNKRSVFGIDFSNPILMNVSWPLWYKILESAFTKYKFWKAKNWSELGGHEDDVLDFFLGDSAIIDRFNWNNWKTRRLTDITYWGLSNSRKIGALLEKFKNFNKDTDMMSAGIIPPLGKNNYLDKLSPRLKKEAKKYKSPHAYPIKGYDKENKVITLGETWDTSKTISLPLDDFLQIFSRLTFAKLDKDMYSGERLWKYADLVEIRDGKRLSKWVALEEIRKVNANLSDTERLKVASEILGRPLNEKEKESLLNAHYTESGKNITKGRILIKEWGYTRDEAQILMDIQLAGIYIDWWNSIGVPLIRGDKKVFWSIHDFEWDNILIRFIEEGQLKQKEIPNDVTFKRSDGSLWNWEIRTINDDWSLTIVFGDLEKTIRNPESIVSIWKSKHMLETSPALEKRYITSFWEMDYTLGIQQSNRYNNSFGYSRFTENIRNWFVDGWWTQKFFTNLNEAQNYANQKGLTVDTFKEWSYWVSTREFINIDIKQDMFLRQMLEKVQGIKNINPKLKAQEIAKIVFNASEGNTLQNSRNLVGIMNLGDIFTSSWAVCRHRSLLFHILWKEIWLDVAMRKWHVKVDWGFGKHAWNEVKIDGKWYVIDTTYIKWSAEEIHNYEDLPNYGVNENGNFTPIYILDQESNYKSVI